MSAPFQLAQINVARMLAPLDSPQMADFVALLSVVNAEAERSMGYVWRLQTEDGDATSLHAFDDPMILVNMSVWESVETLRTFTYQTGHRGPLRDRSKWFELPKSPHMALWWVPPGHRPSVQEGIERLEHRRAHGDTERAFSFTNVFPAPEIAVKSVEANG